MEKILECEDYEKFERMMNDKGWRVPGERQAYNWVWFSVCLVEHLKVLNHVHHPLTACMLNIKTDSSFVSAMPPDLQKKFRAYF